MCLHKNMLCYGVRSKRFLSILIISYTLILCTITILITMPNDKTYQMFTIKLSVNSNDYAISSPRKLSTKYINILLWTCPKCFPFVYFGEGNKVFTEKRCKWRNCYVTGNRSLLGTYTEFEVILFNGPQMASVIYNDYPKERKKHQKFVYANIESATNYPIYSNSKYAEKFEGMFNWTWTYKLNSDAVWGYFVIKDANGNVIGPSQTMHWTNVTNMDPIDEQLKTKLRSKSKAAVWFSSNCLTSSRREEYVSLLQYYLKKYNLYIDIYGDCGPMQCPQKIMEQCLEMVRKKYYFYLAFENSFSDDYVTEKILYALNYDTVPVVYGGANYSRFLPEGIYLDAMKLQPEKLAKTMYEIIQEPERYHKMFRWKTHYSYHFKHKSPDTDDYCKFCEIVNNNTLMKSYKVYENFSSWWMYKQNVMSSLQFSSQTNNNQEYRYP